jgi:hypothetical protein
MPSKKVRQKTEKFNLNISGSEGEEGSLSFISFKRSLLCHIKRRNEIELDNSED